jgi:D-sedoheptulose 7-phosphate isomerase
MTNSFVTTSATSTLSRSTYVAYFERLHQLLLNVVVVTKDGMKLNIQDGADKAIAIIEAVKSGPAKVMIIGNGGSAAIASHQAIDLSNAAGIPAMTFNDAAQITCLSNDFGYENVFSRAINVFAQPDDVLIAISSSGKSASILNGVKAATEKGCRTITLAGFNKQAPLLTLGDLNFYVDSDEYGPVEVAHSALIHYLTDTICAKQRGKGI